MKPVSDHSYDMMAVHTSCSSIYNQESYSKKPAIMPSKRMQKALDKIPYRQNSTTFYTQFYESIVALTHSLANEYIFDPQKVPQ